MIWRIMTVCFCGALALCATPQSKSSSGSVSMTGCLDEQPGPQYVLRGLNELKLIAKLEPDGFAVQSFAKYLGRKVSVKGRLISESDPAVMRVTNIKALSGPCAPAESVQGQTVVTGRSEVKTLTGCIDEQPGSRYTLIGAEKREVRAELEPVGFAVQNFARFLGHSVSIRGDLFTDRTPPLMRIKAMRDIKEVADRCAPK